MKTIHEFHQILCEVYQKYPYVSTPLLQHIYGIPFEEATEMLRYAVTRGWVEEESNLSFDRAFLAPPLSQKSLSEQEIIDLAENLSSQQINFLLRHVKDEDGIDMNQAVEERKKDSPLFFSAIKEKKGFYTMIQMGVLTQYEKTLVVIVDEKSLLQINDLKT